MPTAASRSAPTNSPPDRRAHRRGLRPAVARHRRNFRARSRGRVLKAFATHDTWSGITLDWPVDGGDRLPVELSGLPVFDRARNFAGYRGFGVCRDLDALARLAALRRYEFFNPPAPQPLSADIVPPEIAAQNAPVRRRCRFCRHRLNYPHHCFRDFTANRFGNRRGTPNELPEEAPKNVLPFRPISEPKSPVLTPVENSAFNELARQLAERLERENDRAGAPPQAETPEPPAAAIDQPPAAEEATAITSRTAELAGADRAAGARRKPPRQGAARSDAGRRADLPARPAALCQRGVPRSGWVMPICTRWKKPAASTRSMSNPACPTPAAPRIPARR